jgi:hypothetical protein
MVQNEDLVIENELYTLPNDLEKLIITNGNKKYVKHQFFIANLVLVKCIE